MQRSRPSRHSPTHTNLFPLINSFACLGYQMGLVVQWYTLAFAWQTVRDDEPNPRSDIDKQVGADSTPSLEYFLTFFHLVN